MQEDLAPILSRGTSAEGLARLLEEGVLPPARVVGVARELVGLSAHIEADGS
jgi:hypothetical protein